MKYFFYILSHIDWDDGIIRKISLFPNFTLKSLLDWEKQIIFLSIKDAYITKIGLVMCPLSVHLSISTWLK